MFHHYKQLDQMDCGPTCLRMVAKYYGRNFSLQKLREISGINREGVSLLGISYAAEIIGFRSTALKINIYQLGDLVLPCILHWKQNHFVVLYKIGGKRSNRTYHIADPAKGLIKYDKSEFIENWLTSKDENFAGVALMLTPSPDFFSESDEKTRRLDWSFVFKYLYGYKRLVIQLFIGLGIGSLLQLVIPFLTQSIVDVGINTRNLNFVSIILVAQTMLFLGRISVDFIRSWILLHISSRINISIVTDFLIKLMKLPLSFFETKMTGDIMQRMSDQTRIQNFLTGSSLGTIFSLFNLFVFAFVLAYYNTSIFFIFLISSGLYTGWVLIFLKKRRDLDFKRFDISSENQSSIVQLISGMQEIKLSNSEQQKRWEWERIQANLFRFNIKSLALGQYQQIGGFFINEGKNILITFIVAKAVIEGQLTLGGMMAVQYIVGQLNSPIEQLLGFLQQFQDAKISLERLNEIHEMTDEDTINSNSINQLPINKSINIENLSFAYPGVATENVLKKISMKVPEGKTTAIVGMSGGGKTTILKLLLRFYEVNDDAIKIGNTKLSQFSSRFWRSKCGVVMQDGFIFSDTILRNIAVGDEYPEMNRIEHAVKIANIDEFINGLALGINTKIGAAGNGISQGQKQRILIARAVYKNPDYIFFDEATNALDANNESVIMENLEKFFEGRTVLIVAHRLSTVKNADNIVVLDNGKIVEQGTHDILINLKGEYYRLVKNQLELSN